MVNHISKKTTAGAVEENILAILDSTESDDTHYGNYDSKPQSPFSISFAHFYWFDRRVNAKGR